MIGLFKRVFGFKQNINDTTITDSTVLQAGRDINLSFLCNQPNCELNKILQANNNNELLNSLVESKFKSYRDMLLRMQIGELAGELDLLYKKGIESIQSDLKERLRFYRFCQLLAENKSSDCDNVSFIYDDFKREHQWIHAFWKTPYEVDYKEFQKHLPEIQSLILEKLFKSGAYKGSSGNVGVKPP